ncbi:ABC transporter ATP-binding protein [Sessilibacter sp. MAH4]
MITNSSPLLIASKVSKTIDDNTQKNQRAQILNAIDFEAHPNETIAILGRSGSGKSTLLNILAGIVDADEGEVHFYGHKLHELNNKQKTLVRRNHLGYVFQFFNLVPTLTVEENIFLPLELLGKKETNRLQVEQYISELGLSSLRKRFPNQLSGGEQQRVAILRAISHQPQIILADEPTGSLDVDTGNQVADLLFNSVNETSTLIVVTHSEEIAARANSIYELSRGKLHKRIVNSL